MNRDRLLKTFLDLLAIDSPSGEEAAVSAWLAGRLRALGLETSVDAMHNVIARRAGRGEPLLLNAHVDNVPPCRGVKVTLKDGLIVTDGSTVLGADDKSGVAAILEALAVLGERGGSYRPLEVVFTVQEETGLVGAKNLDYSQVQAREGIVVDGGRPIESVVVKAPSQASFTAVVHGRSAHAGVSPELGINAIQAAAEAIAQMPLGRIDEETTANVGIVEGGRARNIVPDRCRIVAEARSHNPDKLEAQIGRMVEPLREAAARRGARLELDLAREYDAFALQPTAPVVRRLLEAGRALGMDLKLEATGGGSDANIFNARGITCVIMGTGYEDPHTTQERILVDDLVRSTALLIEAIAR